MRIFVAGATGAVGRGLVPALVAAGHDVTGMTRTPAKAAAIEQAGATPVVADALDAAAVARAVAEAEPEVVVNQLTDLTTLGSNMRKFDSYFETTNRLRTEGNDHLLSAARAAGARRFLAQSFGGWPFARDGAPVEVRGRAAGPAPGQGHARDPRRHPPPRGRGHRRGRDRGAGAALRLLLRPRTRRSPRSPTATRWRRCASASCR